MSPRGDPAGFVRVLDDRTLSVPDRPGNRLADSLRNILRNPHVGLLFFVPGCRRHAPGQRSRHDRHRCRAARALAVEGKVPTLGLLIEIDEVFTHCSKAFLRSQLWDADRHVDRAQLPTSGEIHRSLDPSFDADAYDAARAERYARREGFY